MTGALVGRNGAIDWLCWPRFDSSACFAALLGTTDHGRWSIAPDGPIAAPPTRRYRDGTMVLETVFSTDTGEVAVIDFMPMQAGGSSIVRIVEGRRGRVDLTMLLSLRFDYGSTVPWVTQLDDGGGVRAIAGPHMVVLRTEVAVEGRDLTTQARFSVEAGQSVGFVLRYGASHLAPPAALDAQAALASTEEYWREWSGRSAHGGRYSEAVRRSLMVLKALTYAETGGIVAALTTSLPEMPGGVRNWDYRFCWLRDATLTLMSFMQAGYYEEAQAWADWLHRSVAGMPSQVQIMYGLAGERRLDEWEVSWLPGYQGAAPVRIGNAAAGQLQLDVFGEVMAALANARKSGLATAPDGWGLQVALMAHLEEVWRQPDEGIWEVRGGRKHFTFSKVMAWVAFDRAIAATEMLSEGGRLPDAETIGRWRAARDEIRVQVCSLGFDAVQNSFTQSFGTPALDASLLLLGEVGFLPPDDPRMVGTVAAIERGLLVNGFVQRYQTELGHDGLPPGEGAFLACSFWLADAFIRQGRLEEARSMFERLLGCCNDVGLLSEEYDPVGRCMLGNFPQAFSHTALIRTAMLLEATASGMAMAAGW